MFDTSDGVILPDSIELDNASGVIGGIENNTQAPLKVGLPSWDDDKEATVTDLNNETFKLTSLIKSKIAIRVDENIVLECEKNNQDDSYKIVEINGRRYTSVNPSIILMATIHIGFRM